MDESSQASKSQSVTEHPLPYKSGAARVSNTSEGGLEAIIVSDMLARGWSAGDRQDYDRDACVDLKKLTAFLEATQPEIAAELQLHSDNPTRRAFLARLEKEVAARGVIDVLRKGIKHQKHDINLFYGTPSTGNTAAQAKYVENRFSVTRQLRYSVDESKLSLDMAIFINGLPVATFELKNSLTKQTVDDAIKQYQNDRDPRERLFGFGRCMVHFAVDDSQVMMCTHLKGKKSWFLPFNKGFNDGSGNPPNPDGLKTDYLWKEALTPAGLTNILENYAQIVEEKNRKTGKKTLKQVFPRYHQLDLVRKVLADVRSRGVGKRYLIQHSAGSGKSNSIAWLAHQLIGLVSDGKSVFDSIIVITDRTILDSQIDATIRQFMQVGATVGHARHSGDLRKFIESGKKIIISTVQKFPFVLDEIGDFHRGRNFGIIIDEAHSSQGGKAAAAVSEALSDPEDTVNNALEKRMASRKMLTNASYFAFTATPKNRTLEMFGNAFPGEEGKIKHRPFHNYTMKQAIEEKFIVDVLKYYTPVYSWYKLEKVVDDDPMFDKKKAKKKLRRYVESQDHAISLKAEIMVDHFHEFVITPRLIGGEARAMVICTGIPGAVQYYRAIKTYLEELKSPYKAIVAFSGEADVEGTPMTESQLNGFPSDEIADRIQEHPYRFLVCANKFQTGYDEPLLQTMYVDKVLEGVQAVQTLSRLNRSHPDKKSAFVLDFRNNADSIVDAFSDYYRTTLLSEETDQNKLHDLKRQLDDAQVYTQDQIETLVQRFLTGERRDTLDPMLDPCTVVYESLDEDAQVAFKGNAKAFVRTYDFLSALLPYNNPEWEKLSIFLSMLVRKLPAPIEEDLAKGILDAVDMDSYRVEKQTKIDLMLAGDDAEIDPSPVGGGGRGSEPELERLSEILKTFNEQFGTLFSDADRIFRRIKDDVVPTVNNDQGYKNAVQNTPEKARLELTSAVKKAMGPMLKDDTEFYKQFVQNDSFRQFVVSMVDRLISTEGNVV